MNNHQHRALAKRATNHQSERPAVSRPPKAVRRPSGVVQLSLMLINLLLLPAAIAAESADRPNVILAMTDDQGWGEVAYNGHPHLKTPNLDAIAANGLQFDRFYAAASLCSPTRASFMTGRHPRRCRIEIFGDPLPPQEKTIGDLAKAAGYQTAFFGKWHLARGPHHGGKSVAPASKFAVAADHPLSPGQFGFDHWMANHNYYDLDMELGSPQGLVPNKGDSSDVLAGHALDFVRRSVAAQHPFFVVIWYPSPHNPYHALPEDVRPYEALVDNQTISAEEAHCYGEIAAVDRSIGLLRQTLRDLNVADNTLLFFCSDNGGNLKNKKENLKLSTGGLRGGKQCLLEGGVRVPGILEWPAVIREPRRTRVVACTSDLYPTLSELFGRDLPDKPKPLDGISLMPLIAGKMERRPEPLAFISTRDNSSLEGTLLDYPWKYCRTKNGQDCLYNLEEDPSENSNLASAHSEQVSQMRKVYEAWKVSVEKSAAGADYK